LNFHKQVSIQDSRSQSCHITKQQCLHTWMPSHNPLPHCSTCNPQLIAILLE
jgi:hypothetical protein